ncbi:MAG TPA: hypothetical protein VHS53_15815 [Mucilaginibacter sp.]|nr:hypothetical protein [Mucilaginibacter sp.]
MNTPVIRACIIGALQFFTITLYAQNKPAQNILQPPPSGITVDGDLKDWGDSLRYYNEDKKLYYSLANTKDTLYMAIRINDRSEQTRILHAGLTLSIDPKGRKKETFTVTFPLSATNANTYKALAMQEDTGKFTEDARDEEMKAKLTKLSQVKVTGFKDVESDMITTSNTYGFKNAIDFDKDGNMVYELAIPLALFHAEDPYKNEWAFNFKINGITRPGSEHADPKNDGLSQGGPGGMGRGGRGGGMGGGRGGHGGRGGQQNNSGQSSDHSELSKSVDFWAKFFLAK